MSSPDHLQSLADQAVRDMRESSARIRAAIGRMLDMLDKATARRLHTWPGPHAFTPDTDLCCRVAHCDLTPEDH